MRLIFCKVFVFLLFTLNSFSIIPSNPDSSFSKDSSNIYYTNYNIADNPFYTITGNPIPETTKIKLIPTSIFVGTYGLIFYFQHYGQRETIWQQLGKFHFAEDYDYAMYIDKVGHFYGTFLTSYVLTHTLIECGFNYNWATSLGTFLGLAYSTYVEILDGFAVDWGFSPTDFYSDLAGALFFLGYSHIKFMQNFTPKFMYIPPRWHSSYSRIPSTMFIDDYSAHTFWISVKINNLLPENAKRYFPDWLELSFGYAVRNLCDNYHYTCDPKISNPITNSVWGNRKFIVALDYDLVKILPDGAPFWNWLKQSLNFFKLPSPAIEFGNPTRFYLIYPFPIRIGNLNL